MTATVAMVSSVHLEYREGSSDKEYHIYMFENGGLYSVHAEFGRRGKVAQKSEKGTFGSRAGARAAFAALEDEKRGKGYDSMSGTRQPKFLPFSASTFSAASAAAPPKPIFDPALLAFNDKLAPYIRAMTAEELSAGRTATARLADEVGVARGKALEPLPSYNPMVVLLGAVAFACEDYTDDAVVHGVQIIKTGAVDQTCRDTAAMLPATLKAVLDEVLAEYPDRAGMAGLVYRLFNGSHQSWFAR